MISRVFAVGHTIRNVKARKWRSISLYKPYFNKIVLPIYAKQICFAGGPAVEVLYPKARFQTAVVRNRPTVSGGHRDRRDLLSYLLSRDEREKRDQECHGWIK